MILISTEPFCQNRANSFAALQWPTHIYEWYFHQFHVVVTLDCNNDILCILIQTSTLSTLTLNICFWNLVHHRLWHDSCFVRNTLREIRSKYLHWTCTMCIRMYAEYLTKRQSFLWGLHHFKGLTVQSFLAWHKSRKAHPPEIMKVHVSKTAKNPMRF